MTNGCRTLPLTQTHKDDDDDHHVYDDDHHHHDEMMIIMIILNEKADSIYHKSALNLLNTQLED